MVIVSPWKFETDSEVLGVVVLAIIGFLLMRVLRSRPPQYDSPPRSGKQRRKPLEHLTLAERNARDQRTAAGLVKKWKKKGLI
jgi:hypothetical protein